jgi:hypothetical protein
MKSESLAPRRYLPVIAHLSLDFHGTAKEDSAWLKADDDALSLN